MATASSPVIIAVDGSQESDQALEYYVEHFHRPGDKLILASCQEYPPNLAQRSQHLLSEGLVMNAGVWGAIIDKEQSRVDKVQQVFTAKIAEKKLNAEFRRLSGKPGEALVALASEVNAKLIVAGSRGIGRLRKTLLGSVTDYLIGNAPCPVTVYRIDKD